MGDERFVDYYEILQLSPNVDAGTVERVFRYLAKRYHPDNPDTGNSGLFSRIVEAYRVLHDPVERAAFDVQWQRHRGLQWKLGVDAADADVVEYDRELREKMLSLLYVKRRCDLVNPGVGSHDMERLLESPREILDFQLWYLKQKGWIERTDEGRMAITANGVEQVEATRRGQRFRMIENHSPRVRAAANGR
jgi:curved DNA-binding protein CbpA